MISGTVGYAGQPTTTCPNGAVAGAPAKLSVMKNVASIYVLLHNSGPYQAEPGYHIWEVSDGMYNTPRAGCFPYEDCKEWQRGMVPHSDGSAIMYADGHAKWHSKKSREHGWGQGGGMSQEYLDHWIPSSG